MELRSEIGLFQEVRQYVGEMQQQLGHVAQEDYGAGLRIQELETIINRERAQYQGSMNIINQETQQEFAELRDRADRIIVEASEALAAKDVQQFQERELITDEAMVPKQRNDALLAELSQAQNDAIQTIHYVHGEQRSLDTVRARMADEEVAVRNLSGEGNGIMFQPREIQNW